MLTYDPVYFSQITLVLYVVILGLGITRAVSMVGHLFQSWRTIKFYHLHIVWSFGVFLIMLQLVEYIWGFRCFTNWNLFYTMVILSNPLIAYLSIEMIAPEFSGDDKFDMKAFYYKNQITFFLTLSLLPISLISTNYFLADRLSFGAYEISMIGFMTGTLVLSLSRSELIHVVLSIFLFGFFAWFSVFFSVNYAGPEIANSYPNVCI